MSGLSTIDPQSGFLDILAAAWLRATGDDPLRCGEGLIILPTRRGVRALTDAFLRVSGRPALLIPRIDAIGAPDENALAIDGSLDLPPTIGRLQRLASLARLVLTRRDDARAPTLASAFELAASLADLLDEAARHEVDLAAGLPSLAPDALATHWQVTLDFLAIVTRHWPELLSTLGLADPVARASALLDAQAGAWSATPPDEPVWLAGLADATPAEARLARAVARLPNGRVVLRGLDLELDEAAWETLGDTHPQSGLRRLLAALGAVRGDVERLEPDAEPGLSSRAVLLRRAMLPEAEAARRWREPAALEPTGLSVIAARDEQAEAVAIALALRHALETPGRTAALVTPDRGLAARVAAELHRFDVVADDSAGEKLAQTPVGVFLRLLAASVDEALAPATLLALLKHPFTRLGLTEGACRREARRLERVCLRGPRPQPGIAGLRRALDESARPPEADRDAVGRFLDRLEAALSPFRFGGGLVPPSASVQALLLSAERFADPDRLWSGEEGEAMASHLAALSEAVAVLPPQKPDALAPLLDASLAGVNVYGRRALRGRDGELHPRLSIWGLLEARGQTADLLVLGGLSEGTWPPAADGGPWLGRTMRASLGLPAPEIAIGASAHDWTTLACAAPEVILAYPERRDRAPAVPSRWIARLQACLAGLGRTLPSHPAVGWAAGLDQPDGPPRPAAAPRPSPPVSHRPRRLSVTEIETWLRNPYAIYAARVLRLRPLPPLEEDADRALFGNLVHHALARAYRDDMVDADGLQACFEASLEGFAVREGVAAWWRPRLRRIAEWIASHEAARRAENRPDRVRTEIDGRVEIPAGAGPFVLTGRADRIERSAGGLSILDYKTGVAPPNKWILEGWSPQLPLEATMAALGGFGEEFRGQPVRELAHWKLSGGPQPGEVSPVPTSDLEAALADTWHGLETRIAEFDDPSTPYLAQPVPSHPSRHDDYAVLARVAEWRVLEDEE